MTSHKLDTYTDGYQKVPYCTVCSAEGGKLLDECGQVPVVKLTAFYIQKIIDDERDGLDSNYNNN